MPKNNIANFILGSLIAAYPANDFLENLAILLKDQSLDLPDSLRAELEKLAESEDLVNNLRSDYIAIFDHAKSLNPLYETEYGRERALFKARELSDIAGFYKAFYFELDSEGQKEMLDHIAVELEFYALLKMKYASLSDDPEGLEIVLDGMKKFLEDHLGRFAQAILTRDGVKNHTLYYQIFGYIANLVASECQLLGVEPEKLSFLDSEVVDEVMSCGGAASLKTKSLAR